MALKGVKVIEIAGLAPAPHAGMILADFGAKVIRVDRVRQILDSDRLARGKLSVALDLKMPEGLEAFKRVSKDADVLIEPFRPGVMERMGLGPAIMTKENPRLIYARLSGFGQDGPWNKMAGHDINYVSMSGVLSLLGRKGGNPTPPLNLIADFAGGGLMCAMGILMALFERTKSGLGQVIDANLLSGTAYVCSWFWMGRDLGVCGEDRGSNLLDTGAPFYETYRTLDGKFMAVGALEPQFYMQFLEGLGLSEDNDLPFQMSKEDWPRMKQTFARIFVTKTQAEWTRIFSNTDACVTPVLTRDEAAEHPQNKVMGNFLKNTKGSHEPTPAPILSRTPATPTSMAQPEIGQDTQTVLAEAGYSQEDINKLIASGAAEIGQVSSKL
ncbi:alpha-methylacyl-CoA racemase-like [Diadema antillarum]|uniref:alpha-methylacyl-CoA racemase-like n=1 Tax=Diadema antillarum TaxID=105358 RepID=UPI003A8B74B0